MRFPFPWRRRNSLAVEGFVSFGLGFCLSRPLPNEKTAKKTEKREILVTRIKSKNKNSIFIVQTSSIWPYFISRILLRQVCIIALIRKSARKFKDSSHLVSEGTRFGFCLSRLLPNEKTAKKGNLTKKEKIVKMLIFVICKL